MMGVMDAPTPITPAGWYDDGRGQLRWWDGQRWTEHTAPLVQQAAPQAVAPQTARPQQARPQQGELTQVGRSKLVWILPVVLVAAALIGGLLGAVAGSTFGDTKPLERTYAAFVAAERSGDCAALEQVTTQDFREDLTDDVSENFSCAAWRAQLTRRAGSIDWGFRLGPVGLLVVDERTAALGATSRDSVTYMMVRDGDRWKIDDRDDGNDYE